MLLAKELLREVRFDAELPDGRKLEVDGFFAQENVSRFAPRAAACPTLDA